MNRPEYIKPFYPPNLPDALVFTQTCSYISITSTLLWSFMMLRKYAPSTKYSNFPQQFTYLYFAISVTDSWENHSDWQETVVPSRGTVHVLTLKVMPLFLCYFFFQSLISKLVLLHCLSH